MANTQDNDKVYSRDATINVAPGAGGFWTQKVSPRERKVNRLYASVRETGASALFTATVTLQFQMPGDDEWSDYETYTAETRKIIEDDAHVKWRIGVKQGDYTEGELTVGIDW